MKFERDGKYIVRGSKVHAEFLCYNKHGRTYFLCAGSVTDRANDGKWDFGAHPEFDIVPAPKKHKKWVNIYFFGAQTVANAFDSKEEANDSDNAYSDRKACIEVEFEEGQGL